MSRWIALMLLLSWTSVFAEERAVTIRDVGESTQPGCIELRGVGAGAFDPTLWQAGKLHLLRDIRSPLIEPKPGKFRNIYAPSVVKTKDGWAVFYGAWDGTATGNDRIYRGDADAEFLSVTHRHTVIEHAGFEHVCNVNVTRDEQGGWAMMATALAIPPGVNKPITFFSSDGEHWNGSAVPHVAQMDELVSVTGYENYAAADINGMNVLLRDGGKWHMYFGDFRNFGKVFRATGDDGRRFSFDGKVLDGNFAINDVKKLTGNGGKPWYLAGLHMNGSRLWYSLSQDPLRFPTPMTFLDSAGDFDKYIVAIGFVVDGDRVLGALYGAGASPGLAENRIFGVWLQKKVNIETKGEAVEFKAALGPDRQVLKTDHAIAGTLDLIAEDGETLLGKVEANLQPGRAYEIR